MNTSPNPTPTNTSLREAIFDLYRQYLSDKDYNVIDDGKNYEQLFLGGLERLFESLLTAKTNTTDNINLIANAKLPGTWTDPLTGNKLYNEAAVSAKTTEARIEETALNDRMAAELSFTKYEQWCKDRLALLQQLDKGEAND